MWRPIYHGFLRWAKLSRRIAGTYKRTEVTVETDQILVIQRLRATQAWCAECGREVDMVTLKVAAALSAKDAQILGPQPMLPGYGEGRGWHWSQAADGTPLICLESLLRAK
jgi:hypothetical protein